MGIWFKPSRFGGSEVDRRAKAILAEQIWRHYQYGGRTWVEAEQAAKQKMREKHGTVDR